MHGQEHFASDLDNVEEEEEQEPHQPIPGSPPEDFVEEATEYWREFSTPPQVYSTPLEQVTTPRNVRPQTVTPRSRRRPPPPSPQYPDPPSPQVPQPPFTQAPPPSRWLKSGPSSSGRVAYVLFGGQGDEPGIYYNWDSLAVVLGRYQTQHAPAYMGWNTEETALVEYQQYQTTGEIPYKLRINRKIILLNGSQVGVNPPSHQSIPQASPTATPAFPHARSSPTPSPLQPASPLSPTPSRRRAQPASSPIAVSPAVVGRARSFFVVLEGHAPGVYNTHFEAVRAAGAFMATDIVTASTRPAANQMFVDGFMTGRVSSSSQGSGM